MICLAYAEGASDMRDVLALMFDRFQYFEMLFFLRLQNLINADIFYLYLTSSMSFISEMQEGNLRYGLRLI